MDKKSASDRDLFSTNNLPDDKEIYSVSQLNTEVRSLLEANYRSIWLEGEISNLTRSSSGHLYLTLKDEDSEISAVMFAGRNRDLEFDPEDGIEVIVRGTLTVYEPRGRYQFKITEMKEAGKGRLQLKFEKLKKKLQDQGLFDEEHKKNIPELPHRIGIVTSPEGAALRDIVSTIRERYPGVELFLFPTKVQGDTAGPEIAASIRDANEFSRHQNLDLAIVSRGGGSLEDLWAFNEEKVAEAIFNSKLPIISGVGHEVDFTISDFVADLRVPTPTAAGKAAVADVENLIQNLSKLNRRLIRTESMKLRRMKDKLSRLINSYGFKRPVNKLEDALQTVDSHHQQLIRSAVRKLQNNQGRYEDLVNRLSLANPAEIIARGYSITTQDGNILNTIQDTTIGDVITTRLKDGELISIIEEVKENE